MNDLNAGANCSTTLYFETARMAVDLIAEPVVAERWSEPSALDGYDIGELAAHLARAVLTVRDYLAAGSPASTTDDAPVSAACYVVLALGDHDPVDSDFHRGVRQRSVDAATGGADAVVASARSALGELQSAFADADIAEHRITVLGGIMMRLEDYLDTRLVELCIHYDDLSVSIGVTAPELPAEAWERVALVVADVAKQRDGAADFALSLARTERTERPRTF